MIDDKEAAMERILDEDDRARDYVAQLANARLLTAGAVCSTDIVDIWQANADCLNSTCPRFWDRRRAFTDVQRFLRAFAAEHGLVSDLRSSPRGGMKRVYWRRPLSGSEADK